MYRSVTAGHTSNMRASPLLSDSGVEMEDSAIDPFVEELIETIETTTATTTVQVFQVPVPPTPRRCTALGGQLIREPFRWTGLPLEREDDLISAVPDAVSVASSTEVPVMAIDTITVQDSSDDMDIESDREEQGSVELVRTNLQVASRREMESILIESSSDDEPPQQQDNWQVDEVELDPVDYYRNFFIVWNHINLVGHDRQLGPVLLSFTAEVTTANEEHFRVLLWLPSSTLHKVIPITSVGLNPSPINLAKVLYSRLDVDRFKPVVSLQAFNLIASYEKEIKTTNHLFGVLRSRSTPALTEFLQFLGQLVQLRDRTLVFTVFNDKDIEFRVTSCDDPGQQLVAIHFKDDLDLLKSNPLSVLIMVQPIDPNTRNCRYRVTVGDDQSQIFARTPELREFILTKLIGADNACKSKELRGPLLRKLVKQLEQQTREFLGGDRDEGKPVAQQSMPPLDVNTWKYAQLQNYMDDYGKLMRWANWTKVRIGKREHDDEVEQERIGEKFSALEQFGAELLRLNSQVSLEIQRKIEPLQAQVSQCKRDLLEQISGPPVPALVPAPVAPPVQHQTAEDVEEKIAKKEEKVDERSLSNETLVYQRLVAEIEDEWRWINQKERWLESLEVKNSSSCLGEKYNEFTKEFVFHWDNYQNMCAEGRKLPEGRFREAIGDLCTMLRSWFDQLQTLASQALGSSSVATTDSGFLSATDSSLVPLGSSPPTILNALAKSIRVDKKNLWTTCVGMRRAWQYNRFLYISEVTLAQIIEIVGFFLDHVAALVRKTFPEDDPDRITKWLLLTPISDPLFSFFREDRQRGEWDLETLIKKRVIKERFLRTFSRKTKMANEAANLLQLLTLDFVMYFRKNTRNTLDGAFVTKFEHIDEALRKIGFGFLIRPDENGIGQASVEGEVLLSLC